MRGAARLLVPLVATAQPSSSGRGLDAGAEELELEPDADGEPASA